MPGSATIKPTLATAIESLLDLMEIAPDTARFADTRIKRRDQVPMTHFDGAEPILEEFFQENRVFFTDVTPADVDGAWDVATITLAPDDWRDDGARYQFSRHRSTPLSQWRGRRVLGSPASEVSIAFIRNDRSVVTAQFPVFLRNGVWVGEDHSFRVTSIEGEYALLKQFAGVTTEHHAAAQLALGMQFNRRYEWYVLLGIGTGPRIRFQTDPTGAQEVFRLRDVPPGAARRAALRNWVSEHWRTRKDSGVKDIQVRQHLRGATDFTWSGLRCQIIVPPDDLERNERLKADRATGRRDARRCA
jgi:hypothetical protein